MKYKYKYEYNVNVLDCTLVQCVLAVLNPMSILAFQLPSSTPVLLACHVASSRVVPCWQEPHPSDALRRIRRSPALPRLHSTDAQDHSSRCDSAITARTCARQQPQDRHQAVIFLRTKSAVPALAATGVLRFCFLIGWARLCARCTACRFCPLESTPSCAWALKILNRIHARFY